ncbi:ABC transporter ATP-binding protein [Priestia aryabhattai]|uniref:ATP-binding cassette domain-containing protein n=1 Tax=Priestia aryabhattai TaxID=412384 RepID=UPI001C8D5136|nr:ABC transporter ATP-binding protein [Priestia aryabhattai]MBY0008139.1 ABC transporter ATP-binding protein [Priestia aryabhattai]MBY0049942.1 ABC transporter ATP-binding protein [Priestia aryabhattai]
MYNTNFLYINSLTKSFENKLVLNNLSLEINSPSIVSIVGSNGIGKSVLLNCMLNFINHDSGEIKILGQDNNDRIFLRKSTALVSSDHQQHLEKLTPKEYFHLIIDIYNISKNEGIEKYVSLSKEINLFKDLDSNFSDLSFGTRKKVQLLGALLYEPAILVCDEIFEGLDVETVAWIKKIFIKLKEQGNVVLFTSHILQHTIEVCDEMYRLKDGQLHVYNKQDNNIEKDI